MMDMLWKVRTFIKEEDLLAAGDRVLVALSGGADSVCLLLVLSELAGEGGWEIRAMHVHHGLRGQEADRDEDFVRKLCGRLGVPLFVVHRDVAGYAREHGLSAEEAGRILRYQALEEYGKYNQKTRCLAKESGYWMTVVFLCHGTANMQSGAVQSKSFRCLLLPE